MFFVEAFLVVMIVMLLFAYEKQRRGHESQLRNLRVSMIAAIIDAQAMRNSYLRQGQRYQDHQLLIDIMTLCDRHFSDSNLFESDDFS